MNPGSLILHIQVRPEHTISSLLPIQTDNRSTFQPSPCISHTSPLSLWPSSAPLSQLQSSLLAAPFSSPTSTMRILPSALPSQSCGLTTPVLLLSTSSLARLATCRLPVLLLVSCHSLVFSSLVSKFSSDVVLTIGSGNLGHWHLLDPDQPGHLRLRDHRRCWKRQLLATVHCWCLNMHRLRHSSADE